MPGIGALRDLMGNGAGIVDTGSLDAVGTAARRRRLAGIGLMCGALMCFAGLDGSAKWLGRQGLDPVTITWARYAFAMMLTCLFVNPVTTPSILRPNRLGLQVVRSLLLLACTVFNFIAIRYMQLAETMSIQFATPLLIALIAGPLLGEWIGPKRLAAVGVGFLGVLVVVRPGFGDVHPAALLSVGNVVCYAFYNMTTRRLAAYDSTATTTFFSGLAGVVFLTPMLPFFWTAPTSLIGWVLLVALGFFGGFGHWLLVLAHARAPAAILAPFIYTQLVWMLVLGYAVFSDVPSTWTLAGAGIVVASGLYLLGRERQGAAPAGP